MTKYLRFEHIQVIVNIVDSTFMLQGKKLLHAQK